MVRLGVSPPSALNRSSPLSSRGRPTFWIAPPCCRSACPSLAFSLPGYRAVRDVPWYCPPAFGTKPRSKAQKTCPVELGREYRLGKETDLGQSQLRCKVPHALLVTLQEAGRDTAILWLLESLNDWVAARLHCRDIFADRGATMSDRKSHGNVSPSQSSGKEASDESTIGHIRAMLARLKSRIRNQPPNERSRYIDSKATWLLQRHV